MRDAILMVGSVIFVWAAYNAGVLHGYGRGLDDGIHEAMIHSITFCMNSLATSTLLSN